MTAEPLDLLACVLELRPLPAPDRELPPWWGRAAHSLFLDAVRGGDPALAESLHHGDSPRPFTASNLMGSFPRRRLDPAGTYRLRYTALNPVVAAWLSQAVLPGGAFAPGGRVELDHIPFEVCAVLTDPAQSPWAARAAYHRFSADHLLAGAPPARRLRLLFTSPTVFRSGGVNLPLPLPDLVFGSLLSRWNQFAPLAMPEETRRYARECLAVSAFSLRSRLAGTKQDGVRSGAVGEVTYVTLNYDRYWMSLIQALAGYAFYAGVGAGTAMGMGQCRPSPRPEGRREP